MVAAGEAAGAACAGTGTDVPTGMSTCCMPAGPATAKGRNAVAGSWPAAKNGCTGATAGIPDTPGAWEGRTAAPGVAPGGMGWKADVAPGMKADVAAAGCWAGNDAEAGGAGWCAGTGAGVPEVGGGVLSGDTAPRTEFKPGGKFPMVDGDRTGLGGESWAGGGMMAESTAGGAPAAGPEVVAGAGSAAALLAGAADACPVGCATSAMVSVDEGRDD